MITHTSLKILLTKKYNLSLFLWRSWEDVWGYVRYGLTFTKIQSHIHTESCWYNVCYVIIHILRLILSPFYHSSQVTYYNWWYVTCNGFRINNASLLLIDGGFRSQSILHHLQEQTKQKFIGGSWCHHYSTTHLCRPFIRQNKQKYSSGSTFLSNPLSSITIPIDVMKQTPDKSPPFVSIRQGLCQKVGRILTRVNIWGHPFTTSTSLTNQMIRQALALFLKNRIWDWGVC